MKNSEQGPFWGGSAVEWQQKKPEREKEIKQAIADLPILFDTDNFQDLIGHINLLHKSGIENIRVGSTDYTKKQLKDLLKVIIEDFSQPDRIEKVRTGEIGDEKIIQYLKKRGVTGSKISEESLQGFRECLLLCIKHMSTQTT